MPTFDASPKSLCGADDDDIHRAEIRNQLSLTSKVIRSPGLLMGCTSFELNESFLLIPLGTL